MKLRSLDGSSDDSLDKSLDDSLDDSLDKNLDDSLDNSLDDSLTKSLDAIIAILSIAVTISYLFFVINYLKLANQISCYSHHAKCDQEAVSRANPLV